MPNDARRYVVDGAMVRDLKSMCEAFALAVAAPRGYFGFDLQSFDDCLFGGFGLEAPCVIVWRNASASRVALDGRALARACEDALTRRQFLDDEGGRWLYQAMEDGLAGRRTLFDEVVGMITSVTARAAPKGWSVELVLQEGDMPLTG